MSIHLFQFTPAETAEYTWQVPELWISTVLQQVALIAHPESADCDDFIIATSDFTPDWAERRLKRTGLGRATRAALARNELVWYPLFDEVSRAMRLSHGTHHSMLDAGMAAHHAIYRDSKHGGLGLVFSDTPQDGEWIGEFALPQLGVRIFPLGPSVGSAWLHQTLMRAFAGAVVFGLSLQHKALPALVEARYRDLYARFRVVAQLGAGTPPGVELIVDQYLRFEEVQNA